MLIDKRMLIGGVVMIVVGFTISGILLNQHQLVKLT